MGIPHSGQMLQFCKQTDQRMKKHHFLVFLFPLFTISVRAQKSEIYSPGGKAIDGYDPVAFFTKAGPLKGVDSLAYSWKGSVWLFANRQDLRSFSADPEKYAPQYGGYCAYGAAQGHKASSEIDTWTVVNGKLYFNYNGHVKGLWIKDQQAMILTADKQWPGIKDKD
jgi:YHS domain-containing protein